MRCLIVRVQIFAILGAGSPRHCCTSMMKRRGLEGGCTNSLYQTELQGEVKRWSHNLMNGGLYYWSCTHEIRDWKMGHLEGGHMGGLSYERG